MTNRREKQSREPELKVRWETPEPTFYSSEAILTPDYLIDFGKEQPESSSSGWQVTQRRSYCQTCGRR